MMFHTTEFIIGFLPVCITGFFTLGRFFDPRWALRWLIACSLFFYGWWNPDHLPLLLGSVALNYALARRLRQIERPNAWLTAGVTLNLVILGWFKYADFLLHIAAPNASGFRITLPLAVSFFTFQQIMFLVDTARAARRPSSPRLCHGRAWPGHPRLSIVRQFKTWVAGPSPAMTHIAYPAMTLVASPPAMTLVAPLPAMTPPISETPSPPSLLTYAAFVTFFPHLIAGPIVRPSEIMPQLAAADLARPRIENITDGTLIFLLGLGKKLVLAEMFGGFADTGFNAAGHGASLSFFEAWYATLAYALQIYFDFSGYSDMAIGLARMFNVRFPLNFDSPYQATNIAEFWRRWHITLGGFLRDYLYIPLGGSRTGPLRQTANLMITMLLCGLWHGAAWNFVVWGGLHGLLIVVHRQYRRLLPPLPGGLGQALTLFAVIVAWVPFRAASIGQTTAMLRGMAGLNGITLPRMIVAAWPPLASIADPVTVMPHLGDARTLSFPEVSACLLLGWLIVLALPNIHRMTLSARHWTLTASFALSMQALFFAPHVAPFLYFRF